MVSLAVLLITLLAWLVVTAWAMAQAARRVGSPRGRFRTAAVCLFVLFVVGVGFTAAGYAVQRRLTAVGTTSDPAPDADAARSAAVQQVVASGVLGLLQLAADFVVVRRAFRLSTARAFAPFGALAAMTVVQFAALLGVVRPYLTEAFVVPTGTMSPTIEAGDRLMANKLARLRRWDVVIYHSNSRGRPLYCKRLVGLPGERLCFDGHGGLLIDGRLAAVPPVLAGRCHATLPGHSPSPAGYADGGTFRLGNAQCFFLGDNIDRSVDSRWEGPTDRSALVGVADLIYWPPGHARLLR